MTAHTQARCVGVVSGVNVITTLRFLELAITPAQKQALAIAIRDRWFDNFLTGCSSSLQYTSIEIKCTETNGDTPYQLSIAKVGGNASLTAHQLAIQWNLYSGQALRRGRGRLFVPGLGTSTISGGVLGATVKTSLDAAMPIMIGRWCAGGSEAYHLGVHSRANNAIYVVQTMGYNSVLSTLRSRRLGVGI